LLNYFNVNKRNLLNYFNVSQQFGQFIKNKLAALQIGPKLQW